MAFEPINTQEEFNERISARLKREREQVEAKFSDYEDLKKKAESAGTLQEQLDAMKAENSGLQTKLDDMKTAHEADLAAAKRETTKLKVASEFNIPTELAARLNGDDEEAIRKDAETVSGFLTNKRTPPLRTGEPGTDPKDDKDAGLLNTLRHMKGD